MVSFILKDFAPSCLCVKDVCDFALRIYETEGCIY
jgi:hypothetical protein